MNRFAPGTRIKLAPKIRQDFAAQNGACATVTVLTRDADYPVSFIVWNKDDPRWCGQGDGVYNKEDFELAIQLENEL